MTSKVAVTFTYLHSLAGKQQVPINLIIQFRLQNCPPLIARPNRPDDGTRLTGEAFVQRAMPLYAVCMVDDNKPLAMEISYQSLNEKVRGAMPGLLRILIALRSQLAMGSQAQMGGSVLSAGSKLYLQPATCSPQPDSIPWVKRDGSSYALDAHLFLISCPTRAPAPPLKLCSWILRPRRGGCWPYFPQGCRPRVGMPCPRGWRRLIEGPAARAHLLIFQPCVERRDGLSCVEAVHRTDKGGEDFQDSRSVPPGDWDRHRQYCQRQAHVFLPERC